MARVHTDVSSIIPYDRAGKYLLTVVKLVAHHASDRIGTDDNSHAHVPLNALDTLDIVLDATVLNTNGNPIRRERLMAPGGFDVGLLPQQHAQLFLRIAEHNLFAFVPQRVVVNRQHKPNRAKSHSKTLARRHAALSLLACDSASSDSKRYREAEP